MLANGCVINFNSIKVQLKRTLEACRGSERIFQFHKGTIKTLDALQLVSAIATNFNSIKVQLKLSRASSLIGI